MNRPSKNHYVVRYSCHLGYCYSLKVWERVVNDKTHPQLLHPVRKVLEGLLLQPIPGHTTCPFRNGPYTQIKTPLFGNRGGPTYRLLNHLNGGLLDDKKIFLPRYGPRVVTRKRPSKLQVSVIIDLVETVYSRVYQLG